MGTTFAGLLEMLHEADTMQYRDDVERQHVREQTMNYVVRTMLEKLRDLHDPK